MKTFPQQIEPLIPEWAKLFAALIPTIHDDYRTTDDPNDETPGMQITIGFTPAGPGRWDPNEPKWNYQTGDNSYTGGAYSHPHWAIVYLYRDTNPQEAASDAAEQILELCNQ